MSNQEKIRKYLEGMDTDKRVELIGKAVNKATPQMAEDGTIHATVILENALIETIQVYETEELEKKRVISRESAIGWVFWGAIIGAVVVWTILTSHSEG